MTHEHFDNEQFIEAAFSHPEEEIFIEAMACKQCGAELQKIINTYKLLEEKGQSQESLIQFLKTAKVAETYSNN